MEQNLKLNFGTALSAAQKLENLPRAELINWFAKKNEGKQPLFYSSVDIRNFGHKLAPVDTNIFPAGWNNLSEKSAQKAAEAARDYFTLFYPNAKSVAILAENFSRNQFYFQNLQALQGILKAAITNVKIYMDDEAAAAEANFAHTNYNFAEDIIIINRDFTSGSPPALKSLQKPVIPPPAMGWYRRKKSTHFDAYNKIATEFASHFGFDEWLISSYHANCGKVNFKERTGLDCVAMHVEKTLHKIRQKYEQFGITSDPYVFVKSNSGTFGMGIMTAKSGAEVLEMNKKLRNKMDVIKEGVQNTEVIIQEGIPTIDSTDGKTAEPFVYLIGGKPVGAILRVNSTRDEFGNLNSSGMEFEKMECSQISAPCEFSPLGIIARLAALATLEEKY